MNTIKTCPGGNQAIPLDAPGGLCPKCLMLAGLDTGVGTGPETRDEAGRCPFAAPTPEDLAPFFPQLEILELLGRGGMGAVYKARQTQLDRFVAVKILAPGIGGDPAFAERFTREAKALSKLNHPNIAALYEYGQTGGLFYFIMEFVEGLNLRQLLDPMDPPQRPVMFAFKTLEGDQGLLQITGVTGHPRGVKIRYKACHSLSPA